MSVTTTVPSTLADIRLKFRRVTATPSPSQFSDEEVDKYIQTFYVQDFPEHLRLFNLKETYTFATEANIDSYAFERNRYISVQPPLYVDGYQSFWAQSREQFYQLWPKIEFQVEAGNGSNTVNQTFQIPERPIHRAQPRFNGTFDSDILLCVLEQGVNTQFFETVFSLIDDGNGNLIDSLYLLDRGVQPPPLLGTVDYLTGTFVVFAAIPANQRIRISSVPYTPGRTNSVLFFDDRFVLRPVPDSCYKVSIEAWINPLVFLTTESSPELDEWWQCIALGASLKFFEDQGNMDDYIKFLPIFEKYKLLAQRRTIVQMTNQRTSTIYEDQTTFNLNQNFFNRF